MDIEIQTELKPEYAHVYCRGVFNSNEMLDILESAFQFAASEGRTAVLVDIRDLTGERRTIVDLYQLGERFAELQRGCGRGIAIAIVGNEPIVVPQRFAETVARNRGARVRVFTDIDETLDWIEKVVADAEAR